MPICIHTHTLSQVEKIHSPKWSCVVFALRSPSGGPDVARVLGSQQPSVLMDGIHHNSCYLHHSPSKRALVSRGAQNMATLSLLCCSLSHAVAPTPLAVMDARVSPQGSCTQVAGLCRVEGVLPALFVCVCVWCVFFNTGCTSCFNELRTQHPTTSLEERCTHTENSHNTTA